MHLRYPINILSTDINETIGHVADLLGAEKVSNVQEGTKIEDTSFIGPFNLVKDLYARQNDFDRASLRILVDEKLKTEIREENKSIIANGVYLPPDYSGNLPFLMLYKRVDVLDGKPVLISENYLTAGELVVVPETSELFAVLFHNDGKVCKIPDDVQWYRWFGDKKKVKMATGSKISYQINFDAEYADGDYREGELFVTETPLLECESFSEQLLDNDEPVIQIYPILSDRDFRDLLRELKSCKAWVRRTGENNILYTQETFDILEFSQKPNSHPIFGKIIAKLRSKKLWEVMTKLSGMKLSALREVYAFHMQSNEFITRHADSTLNGQLLVRFNWLLQSPSGRDYDLRFWKGKNSEKPITRYKSIPNSATIFYVGETTPHDLTPLPEYCDKDRYNIVLTFGI